MKQVTNQNCKCPICGIEFAKTKWKDRNRVEGRKFCSLKCKGKEDFKNRHNYYQNYWLTRPNLWKWKKERACKQCGNKFVPNNPRQIGC